MGPLASLLTLPASGPLSALTWIARQIQNAANQELLDPARIETALLLLERKLENGEIEEAAFEAEEERLLAELAEITALRQAGADAPDGDSDQAAEDDASDEVAEAGQPTQSVHEETGAEPVDSSDAAAATSRAASSSAAEIEQAAWTPA